MRRMLPLGTPTRGLRRHPFLYLDRDVCSIPPLPKLQGLTSVLSMLPAGHLGLCCGRPRPLLFAITVLLFLSGAKKAVGQLPGYARDAATAETKSRGVLEDRLAGLWCKYGYQRCNSSSSEAASTPQAAALVPLPPLDPHYSGTAGQGPPIAAVPKRQEQEAGGNAELPPVDTPVIRGNQPFTAAPDKQAREAGDTKEMPSLEPPVMEGSQAAAGIKLHAADTPGVLEGPASSSYVAAGPEEQASLKPMQQPEAAARGMLEQNQQWTATRSHGSRGMPKALDEWWGANGAAGRVSPKGGPQQGRALLVGTKQESLLGGQPEGSFRAGALLEEKVQPASAVVASKPQKQKGEEEVGDAQELAWESDLQPGPEQDGLASPASDSTPPPGQQPAQQQPRQGAATLSEAGAELASGKQQHRHIETAPILNGFPGAASASAALVLGLYGLYELWAWGVLRLRLGSGKSQAQDAAAEQHVPEVGGAAGAQHSQQQQQEEGSTLGGRSVPQACTVFQPASQDSQQEQQPEGGSMLGVSPSLQASNSSQPASEHSQQPEKGSALGGSPSLQASTSFQLTLSQGQQQLQPEEGNVPSMSPIQQASNLFPSSAVEEDPTGPASIAPIDAHATTVDRSTPLLAADTLAQDTDAQKSGLASSSQQLAEPSSSFLNPYFGTSGESSDGEDPSWPTSPRLDRTPTAECSALSNPTFCRRGSMAAVAPAELLPPRGLSHDTFGASSGGSSPITAFHPQQRAPSYSKGLDGMGLCRFESQGSPSFKLSAAPMRAGTGPAVREGPALSGSNSSSSSPREQDAWLFNVVPVPPPVGEPHASPAGPGASPLLAADSVGPQVALAAAEWGRALQAGGLLVPEVPPTPPIPGLVWQLVDDSTAGLGPVWQLEEQQQQQQQEDGILDRYEAQQQQATNDGGQLVAGLCQDDSEELGVTVCLVEPPGGIARSSSGGSDRGAAAPTVLACPACPVALPVRNSSSWFDVTVPASDERSAMVGYSCHEAAGAGAGSASGEAWAVQQPTQPHLISSTAGEEAPASSSAYAHEWLCNGVASLTAQQFEREVQLGALLGVGAMGSVHQATWRGQQVAVKVLHPSQQMHPASLASFNREVQVLGRIGRHPNIVSVLAACLHPPHCCIIQELAGRGSLYSAIHEDKLCPQYGALLQLAEDIASAMHHCHQLSPPVVHRDLKTHNVLLDFDGRARVADFGIASYKNRTFITNNDRGALGTVAYMAPETFSHGNIDERADVFSFGVILWECLTGREPWAECSNIMQIVMAVGVERRRLPIPPECPPLLRQLIRDCWREAADRRPSFAEILLRLQTIRAARSGQQRPAATALNRPSPRPSSGSTGKASLSKQAPIASEPSGLLRASPSFRQGEAGHEASRRFTSTSPALSPSSSTRGAQLQWRM